MGELSQVQTRSTRRNKTQTLQLMGFIPVAEQETTGEGDDEEDDRDHQFKLLIFVFVGKSASRSEVNVTNTRGLKAI